MDPQTTTQQKRPRVSEENRKRAVRACVSPRHGLSRAILTWRCRCDGCRRVKEKCEGGVPCRRCLRYRRQCVFTHTDHGEKTGRSPSVSYVLWSFVSSGDAQSAYVFCRHLERAAGLSRQDVVEAERVRCMERILEYYVPNLSFDIQSLRRAADELKIKHRGSDSEAPSTRVDVEELEDLAIDDEDFTIKALPDNTTRESSWLTPFPLGIGLTLSRILGRVFLSEFLNENQAEN